MQVNLAAFVQIMVLTAVIGIVGAAMQFRYWLQLSQHLDVSFFRRDVSRRIIFRGLIGADAQSLRLLRKLRWAGLITLLPIVVFGGVISFAPLVFMAVCVTLGCILSKPYVVTPEGAQ